MSLCHVWGWQPPQTASPIHHRHEQSVWAHWYVVYRHMLAALSTCTPPTLVTCWGSGSLVESKWCHYIMFEADSHLKLLLISYIHIRHIQIVWAHWYNVHWHTVAALHSFTHSNRLRFWGSGSLVVVELKWCHYVMFEADSHLNLLPPSILDINKVFEHIDMLSIGIW